MLDWLSSLTAAYLRWISGDDRRTDRRTEENVWDTEDDSEDEWDTEDDSEDAWERETNDMKCIHKYYLTKDKKHDVEFVFMYMRLSGWRAYIMTDIDYKKRKGNFSGQHRLTDYSKAHARLCADIADNYNGEDELNYICWTKNVYNLDDMMAIAAAWCEITFYYISYGGEFPEIQKKLAERGII